MVSEPPRDPDFAAIKPWLLVTDLGMLAYWGLTVAKAAGLVDVPDEWLFSDYENPVVVAWNWSFFPLDVVFSVCGLSAAWLQRRGHPGYRPLLALSMVLTWCAGFMALCFWAVRGDFDAAWWAVNAFLMVWPMVFAPRVWRWFAVSA